MIEEDKESEMGTVKTTRKNADRGSAIQRGDKKNGKEKTM